MTKVQIVVHSIRIWQQQPKKGRNQETGFRKQCRRTGTQMSKIWTLRHKIVHIRVLVVLLGLHLNLLFLGLFSPLLVQLVALVFGPDGGKKEAKLKQTLVRMQNLWVRMQKWQQP